MEDHEGDLDEDEDPNDVDAGPHAKTATEAVGPHPPEEGVDIGLARICQSVNLFVICLQIHAVIVVVIIVNLNLKVILVLY